MPRRAWLAIIIVVATVGATFIFGHFDWFKRNEHVALWLEGVALVLIFGLDYFNRLDEAQEQKREHEETVEQLKLLRQQAEAAKMQADSSSGSLQVLKEQAQEQQLRELWRVLPILDDIQGQTRYWLSLFDEDKWNAVNEASRIMPADSSSVLIQAARHSNELWTEVRETFRLITNADYQIARYYGQPNVANRSESLIKSAHDNLKNAKPKLNHIVGEFTVFEETERKRNGSQKETG
jgi:hypothetical protein